jgi:hypothetical protein
MVRLDLFRLIHNSLGQELTHCRVYDKRTPIEAQYPSPRPSASQEYVKDDRKGKERKILLHAPPG